MLDMTWKNWSAQYSAISWTLGSRLWRLHLQTEGNFTQREILDLYVLPSSTQAEQWDKIKNLIQNLVSGSSLMRFTQPTPYLCEYLTEQAQQTLMVKMGNLRKGKLVVPPIGQKRFSEDEDEVEEWDWVSAVHIVYFVHEYHKYVVNLTIYPIWIVPISAQTSDLSRGWRWGLVKNLTDKLQIRQTHNHYRAFAIKLWC